jgi:dTDP-4-dehydrorhamnose reductase
VKILVTGSQGQLGSELLKLLDDPFPVDIGDCDLTLQASVDELFKNKFDAVIHCAAYTNVDKAEIEPEKAYAVNALATENIARHCKDIPLVYLDSGEFYVLNSHKWSFIPTEKSNIRENLDFS